MTGPTLDATTSDGRDVPIKTTFKTQLTIRSVPVQTARR